MKRFFQASVLIAVLAFVVIGLGAYTRLRHAGLGCPDWPGCYGHWWVGLSWDEKAWLEMLHRYVAGSLSMGILLLTIWGYFRNYPIQMLLCICVCILLQVLLGAYTVTWKLHPVVVSAHLLFGFLIVLGLSIHAAQVTPLVWPQLPSLWPLRLTLGVLLLQILLGAWTSTQYAALACPSLPTCQGVWWPDAVSWPELFWLPSSENYEGGILTIQNRQAIHLLHRYGAVLLTFTMFYLLKQLLCQGFQRTFYAILMLTTVQWILGLTNIWGSLPILNALAHHLNAAILWSVLGTLWWFQELKTAKHP